MRIIPRKRKYKIIALIVLVLLIAGAGYGLGWFDKEEEKPAEAKKYYSQLTGKEVSKEESERPILGIMLENSKEARPQTGLDSAGIVFETVTEGGITRYLALYQEDMPVEVGPVRSVRPYFVNWLMGFDASVAHVGGSEEALNLIKQLDSKSLNQFKYSEPYYRTKSRAAPHNMYVRTEALRNLQEELGHEKSQFKAIPRSEGSPSETPQAESIKIDFSAPLYLAEFKYDKTTNSYTRFLAGSPHIDAETNQPITVANLVVLEMPSAAIDAIGGGEALIFKDGNVTKAEWKQSSEDNRVELVDSEGNQISLNRGDTWFAAVPAGRSVTY